MTEKSLSTMQKEREWKTEREWKQGANRWEKDDELKRRRCFDMYRGWEVRWDRKMKNLVGNMKAFEM